MINDASNHRDIGWGWSANARDWTVSQTPLVRHTDVGAADIGRGVIVPTFLRFDEMSARQRRGHYTSNSLRWSLPACPTWYWSTCRFPAQCAVGNRRTRPSLVDGLTAVRTF
jgi:hypothetical protein